MNFSHRLPVLLVAAMAGLVEMALPGQSCAAEAKLEAGLFVTYTAVPGDSTDIVMAPGVSLYVERGKSPTPFLPSGNFAATYEGLINADLRSEFSFQAELSGSLKVEINGATVMEVSGGATPLSKPVRLNKGTNGFKATYTSPAMGDAFVRLGWTEKPPLTSPIPPAAFTHLPSVKLEKSVELRLGRELFLEHRCIRCHVDANVSANGVPELKMDAPSFEGIGARRHYDWMARWIFDPKALRSSARMPRLLTGPTAREEAEAMAAYLGSLQTGEEPASTTVAYRTRQIESKEGEGTAGEPRPLQERLHCVGCHNPPDAKEADANKLSQARVAERFPAGRLAEYLRAPEAHYAWTRMPNFHLSAAEARELEGWLFGAARKPELKPAPTDAALIAKGRKLVQTTGCLNCHSLKLENLYPLQRPSLGFLHDRHRMERSKLPEHDCLGGKPQADYQFSGPEKSALEAFTRSGMDSLLRHVPSEFAERATRVLQCTACHGQLEGFPPLELLGGKLKPEWSPKFIGGDIPHKIRFDFHPKGELWLEARMPSFRTRASDLAAGLAAQHGYPPKSPPEPPVNAELAKVGHKLVGKDGGFSCISCHAVGSALAMEVFESEGSNLALSADRLLPDYYRRWLRSPLSIDPQTKMPTYFDEGKSPFAEILGGDAEQQISAVWEYLKLRERMPAPRTGAE